MSIKNTKSARERKFMIKMALIAFGEILLVLLIIGTFQVLALRGVMPKNVFWLVFGIFMTAHFGLLLPAAFWVNRRQRQIQIEDGTYVKPQYQPVKMSRGTIYGSLGGSIFGSLCWLFGLSIITKDPLVVVAVLVFAVILFSVSARKCVRAPSKYWQIAITDMMCVGLFTLLIVNLRWERWVEFYRLHHGQRRDWFFDMPLWGVNLAIAVLFGGLLILFVLRSQKEKRLAREELTGDFGK